MPILFVQDIFSISLQRPFQKRNNLEKQTTLSAQLSLILPQKSSQLNFNTHCYSFSFIYFFVGKWRKWEEVTFHSSEQLHQIVGEFFFCAKSFEWNRLEINTREVSLFPKVTVLEVWGVLLHLVLCLWHMNFPPSFAEGIVFNSIATQTFPVSWNGVFGEACLPPTLAHASTHKFPHQNWENFAWGK